MANATTFATNAATATSGRNVNPATPRYPRLRRYVARPTSRSGPIRFVSAPLAGYTTAWAPLFARLTRKIEAAPTPIE